MTCDWCSLPPNRCTCVTTVAPDYARALRRKILEGYGMLRRPRKLVAPKTEDHAHYYRVIGAAFMRWQMARQLDARNDSPPVTDGAGG